MVTYANGDVTTEQFKIQMDTSSKKTPSGVDTVELDDEQHDELIQYLQARLTRSQTKRTSRLQRYARIDQMLSTWQQLSPEDTRREIREDNTGKTQAIPMNLPVAAAYLDDAVSFYCEIFAPLGGNFYANPGKRDENQSMQVLTDLMNQDTQINRYYMNVKATMRGLNKYNFAGFHVAWREGIPGGTGEEALPGNMVEALDMYNFIYDEEIVDVQNLHKESEYVARIRLRSRLWLLKQWKAGGLINIDKVLNRTDPQSNQSVGNKATYYKFPPGTTRLEFDGSDSHTGRGVKDGNDIDWASFNLSLDSDRSVDIYGHEIIHMYCWINPNQFDLSEDNEDDLQLWQFTICDGKWIIKLSQVDDAVEIPVYTSRLNLDDMREAARSIAEYVRPFQRFVSFLVNTHVAGLRASVWGLKAIDPTMFDPTQIQNGETAGLLKSKKPGADVRMGFQQLTQNNSDTRQNMQDAGTMLDLMKQFFPNQALPAQIAGMDRAVSSQVAAVMQGAMRKLQMFAREIDSSLMLPVRMAQYRNIANYDPNKSQLGGITESKVAQLLNSGLGQIGREAAAQSVQQLLFAVIQNQEAMGSFDVPGLFTLWSGLMNIGTDLGQYAKQVAPAATDAQGNPIAGATAGDVAPANNAGAAGVGGLSAAQ